MNPIQRLWLTACHALGAACLFAMLNTMDALAATPDTVSDSITQASGEKALAIYRAELTAFRREFGGTRAMPDVPFFLFGMGHRTKMLYKSGILRNAISGEIVARWPVQKEVIVPSSYAVHITTANGQPVRLWEDEQAVWKQENGLIQSLSGTVNPVNLPGFADYRYPRVMRVLHQEILINVLNGKPVPNFFVYPKPWYRDGAMMAMCLKATGNLNLLRDWILTLRDPYDRNNAGETEADNLGQALYLVSLTSGADHPLVNKVLAELPRFEKTNDNGARFIQGRSDFALHPAYQTKWLKHGLRALGLADAYTVPPLADGYSALFWMDYRETYVQSKDANDRGAYPYLGWACDHFHGVKQSPISNRDYPLTWEQNASQAKYEGMQWIDPGFVKARLSVPHTWHGAEIFLYLLETSK